MTDYGDFLRAAVAAARAGAAHIRGAERPAPSAWDLKGAADFVTVVDRGTEAIVAESLTQAVPGSVVMGEELNPQLTSAEVLWVVDPLDGTTNYLHDYPAYAVSIGGFVEGTLAVGAVLDVPHDVLYHASRGGGAWCGDRRLRVSAVSEASQALIGTGYPFKHPDLMPGYLEQFTTILNATAGIRRAGAASLDFADLAQGRFDGFWELYLAPWDVAAGTLLIREAGGVVTDLDGNEDTLRHGAFVAGNPAVHGWLMGVVGG